MPCPASVSSAWKASLLRCFEGMPQVEPPPTEGSSAPRVFELRMYESNNSFTLARKIKMFNEGEIGIFKTTGNAAGLLRRDADRITHAKLSLYAGVRQSGGA